MTPEGLHDFAWNVVWPLLLSVLLGGLLGLERELHGKPAGLRTHVLVSLGAAAFTLITFSIYAGILDARPDPARVDPLRLVAGIIGGIGFLGAGSIIRDRERGSVEGLTTAGSIWLAGGIGLACGADRPGIAAATVTLALLVLVGLGRLERWLRRWRAAPKGDRASPFD
jgi:putative Mg2+ transporter-C (MgtC) family protein